MDKRLHDYQRVGVAHLRRNDHAGLFMDMGLGKTATTLSALTDDQLPALVVAPKRVAEHVWKPEARLWRPDLRVAVAAGNPATRARELSRGADDKADLVVLGRDNFADVEKLWKRRRHPFKTLIFDELSGFKSGGRRGSARWRQARLARLAPSLTNTIGLTGTPAPNGLHDLWGQVALLDKGERLGPTLTSFRERWFKPQRALPNGVVPGYDPLPGADEEIWAAIEDICLAMESDGRIELPPVTFNTVSVPLPASVMKAYRELKRDNLALIDGLYGRQVLGVAETAAAVSNKLSQLTAGFIYDEERRPTIVHREKMTALQEIVDGTGSQVLVFYRYRTELDMIKTALGDRVHTLAERDVVERWNNGSCPVLAVHPAAAGHGLNLQHGGHVAVWTSLPNFDLELWEQANKRLIRQGQQHPVIIHVIDAPSTIDGAMMDVLNRKASVQDALLDHLESVI